VPETSRCCPSKAGIEGLLERSGNPVAWADESLQLMPHGPQKKLKAADESRGTSGMGGVQVPYMRTRSIVVDPDLSGVAW